MKKQKVKLLNAAGWSVGTASDFLELNPDESEFFQQKVAVAQGGNTIRKEKSSGG